MHLDFSLHRVLFLSHKNVSQEYVGCMYGHTYSKSMDQPGMVANRMDQPVTHIARAWINRVSSTGKIHISLSAFAHENSVSRYGFGSPAYYSDCFFLVFVKMCMK